MGIKTIEMKEKFTITNKQFYERYKEDYDSHNGGAWLILMERLRHYEVEGWDGQHDQLHDHGELPIAAACYAVNGTDAQCLAHNLDDAWLWDDRWDKRKKHDRVKQLVIAGALIAAEIDRVQGNKERYDGADLKLWAFEKFSSPNDSAILKQLKAIKEAFQWTFDNMATTHTSDHFNVPANGIEQLDQLIAQYSTQSLPSPKEEGPVTLEELPSGSLFRFGETVALKSEYRAGSGAIEAYIVGSGEMFWGETKTAENQKKLVVIPITIN